MIIGGGIMTTLETRQERREDYALRYVPLRYRQWGWGSIFSVMMGIATALFFLAWGGSLVTEYGTKNLVLGMVFGTVFIGAIGYVFASVGSQTGLDSDMITRGAGYGFMGSAITSLIYSFNFVMFSAFEGTIMADAVHTGFPAIPLPLLYILIGLVFIPVTWYGMWALNKLMNWTNLIYAVFMAIVIVKVAAMPSHVDWWNYTPTKAVNAAAGPAILQLLATVLGLITNATIGADVGRFIKPEERRVASFFIGYVFEGATFLGAVLLGSWFALKLGETNPGVYLFKVLGLWGVLFVIVTQLRINSTNTYSGSLAYANFFARVFHFAPGRHWWVVLECVVSTLLMFGGIFNKMGQVLTFEGVFVMSWIMSIVSDILINKKILKLSPDTYYYKRSQLYNWNPVGIVTLIVALIPATPMAFGVFGPYGMTLAPFVSGILGFVIPPIVALATKGKYYVAPTAATPLSGDPDAETKCHVCHHNHEARDMIHCPFVKAPICSVCCAAHASCRDLCKSDSAITAGIGVQA
jgi:purine-cytosine permease-like protein